MAVLALAYVMNLSGQTATLGAWLAGAGAAFALLSPILGWIGVAVTGSDTSSNSLFGALQVQAADQAGLDPVLMAAANSSGGVLGKMVSPQNLAIAAAAVGMSGREGDIFRKVIGWSLVLLALMCVLVDLQSTPVLSLDGALTQRSAAGPAVRQWAAAGSAAPVAVAQVPHEHHEQEQQDEERHEGGEGRGDADRVAGRGVQEGSRAQVRGGVEDGGKGVGHPFSVTPAAGRPQGGPRRGGPELP